jgi:ribonuclease E
MSDPATGGRTDSNPEAGDASADVALAPRASAGDAVRHADATGGDQGAGDAPDGDDATGATPGAPRRRRGSRGGRSRSRSAGGGDAERGEPGGDDTGADGTGGDRTTRDGSARDATGRAEAGGRRQSAPAGAASRNPEELPERIFEGRPKDPQAAERALVRRPQIGDSRPAPSTASRGPDGPHAGATDGPSNTAPASTGAAPTGAGQSGSAPSARSGGRRRRGRGGGAGTGAAGGAGGGGGGGSRRAASKPVPVRASASEPVELDDETLESRRGRERKGKPVGRYLMTVSVSAKATQIAVLEGRNLIEHYVSRPADDVLQIHGNVYLGRVQNVLPGMEAAFVDIGTPKNAVLYRGDVQYDAEDIEEKGANPRIEQLLKPRQTIICQVTKNPIAHKGARLTQEVSLPGRFVVLIPNSTTYGISKRLSDNERKRLRAILDQVKPPGPGIIVRTAAEDVTAEEIRRDVLTLLHQWEQIEALAAKAGAPTLLYREPDMAVRVIREEFNKDYRGVVIDDRALFEEVRAYVEAISPSLADRVQHYDNETEPLPVFERHHVHEQLHKALDRKVWLPSGGSLIIEHTEALTVIDVNTGKNVGTSSLEETVFRNNLEAAEEIAKQLRLRDIGGIIVIDFIDMEVRDNRDQVIKVFRDALARDKTRTQVFDISELGLVEMTRKRIGEGLLESFSAGCPHCESRGVVIDADLLG